MLPGLESWHRHILVAADSAWGESESQGTLSKHQLVITLQQQEERRGNVTRTGWGDVPR